MIYRILADLLLLIHAAFVAFVIIALILILLGGTLKWQWVRNLWFRISHLVAIGVVILQAWLGVQCPLTIWENRLRQLAGEEGYRQGFIMDWVQHFLFYEGEPWVFTLCYTMFGGLVVASWIWIRPERRRH